VPATGRNFSGILNLDTESQSILYAASKYGFTALKSKAEAWCVKFLELDATNVINHLLYAGANSLLLLKKAAMNFITDNSKDVMLWNHFHFSPSLRF
jgi:hypothetical protein